MKNPFRSTRIFVGEMVDELKKATWPTRTELRDSTIVVIVAACHARACSPASATSRSTQVVDLFTSWVS